MKLLVVIIGGNSIPNYGLIKYSLNNDNKKDKILPRVDKVVLVYSNSTKSIAERFKKNIKGVEFFDVDVGNNSDSLRSVEKIVFRKLNKFKKKAHFIHLNYTGGTKSMSIGTFLAVNKLKIKKKVFSYTDMKSNKLYLKRGEVYPKKGTILDNLKIDIDEIFKVSFSDLEEFTYKTKISSFYNQEFAKFLMDKNLHDEVFFENIWDKDLGELKNLNWKESLKDATLNFDLNEINTNRKLKKLQKFIRGGWLEDYIFDFLKRHKKELKFDNLILNFEKKKGKTPLLEVDVLVSKGYNIFLFSCTTDYKKPLVKSKMFEAYKRSEELGGIGAKAISVSLANDETIKDIEKHDANTYIGRRKLSLIGKKELLDEKVLLEKMREIIQ